jgi:hypothetical protein
VSDPVRRFFSRQFVSDISYEYMPEKKPTMKRSMKPIFVTIITMLTYVNPFTYFKLLKNLTTRVKQIFYDLILCKHILSEFFVALLLLFFLPQL